VMTVLLAGVGLDVQEGERINQAVKRLTREQCDTLIREIETGPVKTGDSDVPSDAAGFEHPPAEPEELFTPPADATPAES
jgi:hypothetical protein